MTHGWIAVMMRFAVPLILLLCLSLSAPVGGSDEIGHWFYMVKTEPTDPTRDAEFNAWYDDIDIPDVLAVPGFARAQRAIGVTTEATPDVDLEDREGKYVALYDIETTDIDSSIIDLYVAARRMNAVGRSTDLLRVVEANYYERLAVIGESRDAEHTTYFFIQKLLCCKDEVERQGIVSWFEDDYLPAANAVPDWRGASIYSLYRIMEDWALEDAEIPHLLVVLEVSADSAADAVARAQMTYPSAPPADTFDVTLYRKLNEFISD